MSYSIRIGGAEPDMEAVREMLNDAHYRGDGDWAAAWTIPEPFPGWDAVTGPGGLLPVWASVGPIKMPDAPANQYAPHENLRAPSYAGWADFAEASGLEVIFFGEKTGLMREHPGTVRLTSAHLLAFQAAFVGMRLRCSVQPTKENKYHLDRLDWLVYWTRYALEHCRCPAIHNH
jgi:hypothetical protein